MKSQGLSDNRGVSRRPALEKSGYHLRRKSAALRRTLPFNFSAFSGKSEKINPEFPCFGQTLNAMLCNLTVLKPSAASNLN
jgi:hypothetical protein